MSGESLLSTTVIERMRFDFLGGSHIPDIALLPPLVVEELYGIKTIRGAGNCALTGQGIIVASEGYTQPVLLRILQQSVDGNKLCIPKLWEGKMLGWKNVGDRRSDRGNALVHYFLAEKGSRFSMLFDSTDGTRLIKYFHTDQDMPEA